MLSVFSRFLVSLLAAVSLCAGAQDSGPKQQEFLPKSGNGRVVVLVSGQTGMPGYVMTAQQIADAGFDVVLVDGNEFWIKDTSRAWNMLKEVITRAQAGARALPGKLGVVGYSLGGATALTYAARMPELVAAVVVGYPYTAFIKDPADFVAKIKVPVQMFAGTADTYKDCCRIETARQLADAAKASSPPMLTLHEYDGVGHGFNLATAARKDQAAGQDAIERTIAQLKQALPAEGTK
ncbi:alpha/beta fold hydrolase [Cupriavidus sp. CV2]|uniref:dienelactone hydrolase family protein n=1 Tax=Cupriavidus ulmosensis TaxID=3065913 RepID=UPI00296A9C6A|nr:alpha/beta fold hydrolase [Cupriavidus sp. CV2]MDW3683338.1 alpha/beta fold hydrolase [Cupriavidus sp. CV2]